MEDWFITWNRPEYKEWAKKIPQGYLLLVLRKEPDKFLCVKAELIMKNRGLPDFKVIEEKYFLNQTEAEIQIKEWK